MKTIKFNLCKYTITITIAKKKYKTPALVVEQEQYTSTVNKPVSYYVPDELVEEYKSAPGLAPVKEGIHPISEAFKMEEDASKPVRYTSFYECCLEYIDCHCDNLSPNTVRSYKSIINNHFRRMRGYDISKVDQGFIQKMFDEEIAKGYSKKTLKGYKTLLMKVLAVYRPDLHPEIRIKKETDDENA